MDFVEISIDDDEVVLDETCTNNGGVHVIDVYRNSRTLLLERKKEKSSKLRFNIGQNLASVIYNRTCLYRVSNF